MVSLRRTGGFQTRNGRGPDKVKLLKCVWSSATFLKLILRIDIVFGIYLLRIDSLAPYREINLRKYWLIYALAWCLTAPSHDINQCWFIINNFLCHICIWEPQELLTPIRNMNEKITFLKSLPHRLGINLWKGYIVKVTALSSLDAMKVVMRHPSTHFHDVTAVSVMTIPFWRSTAGEY